MIRSLSSEERAEQERKAENRAILEDIGTSGAEPVVHQHAHLDS